MDLKPPNIDEQYIKLLEQSNLDLKRRSKVFSYRNLLVYSILFILVFYLIFSLFVKNSYNKIDLDSKLNTTVFDASKLLLQYQNTYYEIPQDNSRKILLNEACMVSISGQKMQFDVLSKSINFFKEPFKLYIPSGKHYTLILSDGSRILLNENSQISFVNKRQTKDYNVILQGEAFFKIAHNLQAPFKIKASDMTVEVYGTSFNLTNYPDQKTTRVALLEGSVKVKTPGKSLYIEPGQQAIMNSRQKLIVKTADFNQITAWTDNSLYFKAEKLIDITKKLEKRYQVKFVIPDKKLQNLRFTGKINQNDDLLQFLKILNYTEDIIYTIKNNSVTLIKNH